MGKMFWICVVIIILGLIAECTPASPQNIPCPTITASWYSTESCKKEGTSGVYTASGDVFYDEGMTCAIRSYDFGGVYKVTNLQNGKNVVVGHNDFGPNKRLWDAGRKIDLSLGAFRKIADPDDGVIDVRIEELI